jgi:hypothetical protein
MADFEGLGGTWAYLSLPGGKIKKYQMFKITPELFSVTHRYWISFFSSCRYSLVLPITLRYPTGHLKSSIKGKGDIHNNGLSCFFEHCYCIKYAQIPK